MRMRLRVLQKVFWILHVPGSRSLVGFKIVVLPCALPPSAELLELDLGADVPSLFVKYWKRVWQRGRNTGWAPRWLHHEH